MAFRIYLDQTVIRIVDDTERNDPIQYNPGQVKYYIKDNKFIFYDGIEQQDFNNHGFVDFTDRYGNTFATEIDFVEYLNSFINAPVITSNPLDKIGVNTDEVTVGDVDWEASDFTGWEGEPRDLLGNVNDGGIYNASTDNPKVFYLRFIRSHLIRVMGAGSNVGSHSNYKVSILGSGDTERGVLDASTDPEPRKSTVYKEEQFVVNGIKVEFFTTNRIDLTNLFFKNQFSSKKENIVHKWGANPDVDPGQRETIWTLGDEYIFTDEDNPVQYFISSSSAADTQVLSVETVGVNLAGRLQRQIVDVQLQGQTKTLIPTPFLNTDSNRAFVKGPQGLAGDVYIYEDSAVSGGVPSDLSKVRSVVQQGKNQTRQAVYRVPEFLETGQQVIFFDLYSYTISLARAQSVAGEGSLIVREPGGVDRERHALSLADAKDSPKVFGEDTPLQLPPGSRVHLDVENITNNNTAVFGEFSGSLILL